MKYIVDFNPVVIDNIDYETLANVEEKILNKVAISNEEAEYFLDNICYIARNKINEKMDNYDYKCDLFQSIITYYFRNIDCEVNPCMTQNVISKDITGHSFTVIKLMVEREEKLFLIDPSYIQFFKKENCQRENYYLSPLYKDVVLLTPDPGYFIKDEDMLTINYLLTHGFINLNENVARIYGDSFLNTMRGLKWTKDNRSISGNVYINSFLKGNEVLSKSELELSDDDLLIKSFKLINKQK